MRRKVLQKRLLSQDYNPNSSLAKSVINISIAHRNNSVVEMEKANFIINDQIGKLKQRSRFMTIESIISSIWNKAKEIK